MVRGFVYCLCLFSAGAAASETLSLPGNPRVVAERTEQATSYALPIGVWDVTVPTESVEGSVLHQVVYLPRDAGAFRVIEGLEQQLTDQGYVVPLACHDEECGGFDFRFELDLIPPPDMFVDIGHFSFLSAKHPDGRAVAAVASRTPDRVHLHLTFVTPDGVDTPALEGVAFQAVETETPTEDMDLGTALETRGRAILSDLKFRTGSSELDGADFSSLTELANYLSANPQRTIALVGHTDATGSLESNIALSKKRAGSVRTLLIDGFGIDGNRVDAEGMGYLAPIAANTTDEGRARNRRVEAILTSTN